MTGHSFTKVEQRRASLRFAFPPDFAQRLEGQKIHSLSRRAKYLLCDLEGGDVLVMHLGMSGSFRIVDASREEVPGAFHHPRNGQNAHDHVVFHLSQGVQIIYNDPRRFGYMTLIRRDALAQDPLFARTGIEPLGNELGATWLLDHFAGRKIPLKAALLDQSLIAGLGNIYVCEALHRAHLSPLRQAGSLPRHGGQAQALCAAIRTVLEEAIAAGGSSLRDHRLTDGSLGYFQHGFRVYSREGQPCQTPGCGGIITRIVQSGRSTFYCQACQV